MSSWLSSPKRDRFNGLGAAADLRYGPWALVTGASDGIGKAFARRLAAMGYSLAIVSRREDLLRAEAIELRRRGAPQVHVIAADLSAPGGVEGVLSQTAHLDIGLLVAAAGFGSSGQLLEVNCDEELSMIDVNCRAVVEMALTMARRFKERGTGGIVLLSSVLAFQGVARASTYAATKAFIQSFAEGIAVELSQFGIDVIAAAPGPVRSGFAARAHMILGGADTPEAVASGTLAALGKHGQVRPGRLSKLLGFALAGLPRWARIRVMSRIMANMTRPLHG